MIIYWAGNLVFILTGVGNAYGLKGVMIFIGIRGHLLCMHECTFVHNVQYAKLRDMYM